MIRYISLLAICLRALLLFGNFQCGDPYCYTDYLLRDWQASWLDNSGSEPVSSTGPVPRLALGIGLSARLSGDGTDTLEISSTEECGWSALQPINQLKIFATEGFDTIAAGEEISNRFQLRVSNQSTLQYVPLDQSLYSVNNFYTPFQKDYHLDLLMLEPPSQPGAYRFSVQIQFDSLPQLLNRDTFFTLPTVLLQ